MSSLDSSAAEDDWIGNASPTDKPTTTFRIAFNNINGLGSQQYEHSIQQLVESQSPLGIDLLAIIEHFLNTEQPRVRNTLQRSLQQNFLGRYVLQINSGQMQTTSAYLPGGPATLLVDRIVGRLESNGRGGDTMGRWNCVTLRRQKQKPLTLCTRLMQNPPATLESPRGTNNAYNRIPNIGTTNTQETHSPKILSKPSPNHQALAHDIIVGGDFNGTLFQPNS
jgi:hypothetical protein